MRLLLIAVALSLGAGATFAQIQHEHLQSFRRCGHMTAASSVRADVGFGNPYDEAGMVARMQARPDTAR